VAVQTDIKTLAGVAAENEELRRQLAEAREALEAIRRGDVDAVVVDRPTGPQVYTLTGADTPYRVMVEEMQEGAVTLSDDGVIVYCNKQIARLLNASYQDLLGEPFRTFLAPQSVPLFEALWQRSRNEVSRGEVQLTAVGGALVPVYLALRLLPADGLAQTSIVIADLTEQKRYQDIMASEVFSTSVLDQAQDAIVVCDPSGRVIQANQTAERLCGVNPLLQQFDGIFRLRRVIGPSPDDPRRQRRDAELPLFPLASTVQFLRGLEASFARKDGFRVALLLSVGQMLDVERKLLGTIITMTDITDRKRAEEALQRTAEELARSNRDLAQFASVASHDLQEPLRTVTGFVQLLRKEYGDRLDANAGTYIGYAVDGVKRMQTLISDLLAYARVGTSDLKPAPTDASAALRQALGNLHQSIQEVGAEITHSELPTVLADQSQLAQLLQNLVGNALKFRSEAPPKIHVVARREGDYWQFSVSDNGIGIDPQFRDHIFEIFRRLHTHKQYAGTGIGLAICKKIVDRHGGRIWVESEPGQGATFYFTLPT
jgi:PAS domain S-box-containing protein